MSNEQALPPKKDIEKLVTVEEDIKKVLNGKKTATRRNGRYADAGDIMTLRGTQFKVDRVYRQTLGEVTEEHAKQEGYENLEAYREAILGFHPGMKWLPEMKVWVHEYSMLDEA